jgi:hypothetical protein
MFGKLISTVFKVATLPIDVASISLDVLSGGDGSKDERLDSHNLIAPLEQIRDKICETMEDLDD